MIFNRKNLKKRHEKLKPDCTFVKGLSNNIPTKCLKLEMKRIDNGDQKTTKIVKFIYSEKATNFEFTLDSSYVVCGGD